MAEQLRLRESSAAWMRVLTLIFVLLLGTQVWIQIRAGIILLAYVKGNSLAAHNSSVPLKPIASQLVVEPPSSLKEHPHVPSVDDLLVSSCIGQMAVASGSDLLWKPLNHEVLMQTRSEKLRSRILGLRSVKQMLDNLKEEHLVLLAETIPFLGELLEDVELSVKSLAQEIIKQMEEMSGESLTQHL